MLKRLAGSLLLPVSIALALASCQQPSATPTAPSASASPSASTSPKADASPSASPKADAPKADAAPKGDVAASAGKTKDIDSLVKEQAEYKEMYEATGGIKYIGLVETETCKALDSGVPIKTLTDALEKEFDKQGTTMPADKLAKLKEYTGFVLGASVVISCPQHKDKIKS